MTSLNTSTGKDDGFVRLRISGNYRYPGVGSNPTRVYNQQLSHSGKLDLVEGDFTSVGGQSRRQIFMLNVGGSRATVTAWTSAEFNRNCATVEPFYVRAASWSSHRFDRVHRDHRIPPGRPVPRKLPVDRAVRRGCGLPGYPGQRQPPVDQLHGL